VLAPPLSTLIAMTWGWSLAAGAALIMYLAAGGLFVFLLHKRSPPRAFDF